MANEAIKIKAVFLYPLTKALKAQHERLLTEPDKYDVQDVDDAMEAGQVLSMEKMGILFCSDSKKLLKCLDKYEKLFLDSKYKIILVLPKRIIGKEVADLNNRGVQDILVEPITEKSLTTRVNFNFKMIIKLIEAAEKQARRKEELAKAREAAIEQKKQQDAKRKQKQEEHQKKKSIDSFWNEQEKAQQALMFKPVEGKIQNGTENVLSMENSAASINALNLYNSEVDAYEKTLKEKSEDLKKQQDSDSKEKKKIFDFDGADHVEDHIAGSKNENEEDSLEDHENAKKQVNLFVDPEVKNNLTASVKEGEHLESKENNKKALHLVDNELKMKESESGKTQTDHLEEKEKKKLDHFKEEEMQKTFSGKNVEEEALKKSEASAKLSEDTSNEVSKTFSKNETEHLEDEKKKSSLMLNNAEELKNKESSALAPSQDQIEQKQSSAVKGQQDEGDNSIKGKNAKDHEEVNQKGKSLSKEAEDNLHKSASNGAKEEHDDVSKGTGKGSLQVESELKKSESKTLAENHPDVQKAANATKEIMDDPLKKSATKVQEEVDLLKKSATSQKEEEATNDKSKVAPLADKVDPLSKGKGIKETEQKHDQSKGNFSDTEEKLEKAKLGSTFDGEAHKKTELESNFVDEFTKKKVEEAKLIQLSDVQSPIPAPHTLADDLNSVVFDTPPEKIVRANLQGIEIGLLLLHKLSTSDQKIEEQAYIFPFIANKLYALNQGLITFYVIDSKGVPALLYSSHAEHKDFFATLKMPPIEEHVTTNLPVWKNYRYSTLSDETLHADLIEVIYPFKEGARLLGFAIVHCFKTLRETSDVSRLEMLIEFTRGYFMRFHNIGAQSSSGAKSKSTGDAETENKPWYQKYVDQFNNWLNKGKKVEEEKPGKKASNVTPIKKPPRKKGAA